MRSHHGSIIVDTKGDDDNLVINHSHTPADRILIQRGDRWDLLRALMEAQGIEADIIRIAIP